jgi:tetrahydromethanopterin S-methyltransferase subunit A
MSIVREQMAEATAARKCHACGCFQEAVAALERMAPSTGELAAVLAGARSVFVEKKYDCLGCAVCFPAVAENAFADAFPEAARVSLCPMEAPPKREGWPPLPGDYMVVKYHAPVAVCALNSAGLVRDLAATPGVGLALAGTLHTENLGIERIVRNVLANPNIRFLVLCGEDTRQAIGHLPGQSLASLFEHGLDDDGRILGARGKRPYLRNVTRAQVDAFVRQVELVPLMDEQDPTKVIEAVERCAERNPGPFEGSPDDGTVVAIEAKEPRQLVLDPAGFLVIYPDKKRGFVLEHYTNDGVLRCIIQGATPAAVGATAVERGVVSRLDHAVYLGRELARAEESLRTGAPYTQDCAPGQEEQPSKQSCGCTGSTCAASR